MNNIHHFQYNKKEKEMKRATSWKRKIEKKKKIISVAFAIKFQSQLLNQYLKKNQKSQKNNLWLKVGLLNRKRDIGLKGKRERIIQ